MFIFSNKRWQKKKGARSLNQKKKLILIKDLNIFMSEIKIFIEESIMKFHSVVNCYVFIEIFEFFEKGVLKNTGVNTILWMRSFTSYF